MRIGEFEIGRNARQVAVSVYSDSSAELVNLFRDSVLPVNRLYEIRYDLFSTRSLKDLEYLISKLSEIGISHIFTFRGSGEEALEYYDRAVAMGVSAVDVDVSISGSLKKRPENLIVSMHLKDRRPSEKEVQDLFEIDSDLLKIAVVYSGYEEFMEDCLTASRIRKGNEKAFTLIPMGSNSKSMRVASLILVSDLAYARTDRETAEGQLTYEEYRELFRIIE